MVLNTFCTALYEQIVEKYLYMLMLTLQRIIFYYKKNLSFCLETFRVSAADLMKTILVPNFEVFSSTAQVHVKRDF